MTPLPLPLPLPLVTFLQSPLSQLHCRVLHAESQYLSPSHVSGQPVAQFGEDSSAAVRASKSCIIVAVRRLKGCPILVLDALVGHKVAQSRACWTIRQCTTRSFGLQAEDGPIDAPKRPEDVRQEPYNLPSG